MTISNTEFLRLSDPLIVEIETNTANNKKQNKTKRSLKGSKTILYYLFLKLFYLLINQNK